MIRIYKLLFALPLLLLFAGCKTDTAVVPSNLQNAALIGKWLLKSLDVETQVDADPPTYANYTTFADKDFFEFKANNAAVYSSSIIGAAYTGHYSTNTNAVPNPITFVSGSFGATFYLESLTSNTMVIYQTASSTALGVTTTVTNYYTYKK